MNRKEYNDCVAAGLKGKKLGREERKQEFCIVAKTCSGKAKGREEARVLCSQPKEPKPPRREGSASCNREASRLARCVSERVDVSQVNDAGSLRAALDTAIKACQCPGQRIK